MSHAKSAPDACSVLWDTDATSAWGTAAAATFIVCVEQPGSWGRDAVRDSGLDPAVGRALDAAVSGAAGRLMLVRRPGRHALPAEPQGVQVLVAACGRDPRESVGVQLTVASASDLLDIDWAKVADADLASLLRFAPRVLTDPVLLVCTNGTRDVCCAVRGRPMALDAAADAPGRVWEVSHTGGHRFAPTGVLLPWGLTVARLDEALADALLDMSLLDPELPEAMLGPRHDRGRSCLAQGVGAAESAVRSAIGERRLGALHPLDHQGSSRDDATVVCGIEHIDGRRWEVTATRGPVGTPRPESCGKAAVEVTAWSATLSPPLPR